MNDMKANALKRTLERVEELQEQVRDLQTYNTEQVERRRKAEAMLCPTWREGLPDAPGWWWLRGGPLGPSIPHYVMLLQGSFQMHTPEPNGMGGLVPVAQVKGQWAGPIQEPKD